MAKTEFDFAALPDEDRTALRTLARRYRARRPGQVGDPDEPDHRGQLVAVVHGSRLALVHEHSGQVDARTGEAVDPLVEARREFARQHPEATDPDGDPIKPDVVVAIDHNEFLDPDERERR